MSYWSTRSTGIKRDYVVLKHTLRGINNVIQGIRFRNGYAVVERGSKAYNQLKSIPTLKHAEEYPLTHLNKLRFITRSRDIQMVYGKDVYYHYIWAVEEEKKRKEQEALEAKEKAEAEEQAKREEELKKAQELEQKLQESNEEEKEVLQSEKPEITKCTKRTRDGKLCKNDAVKGSPSNYCKMHLLKDPGLKDLGIEVPKYMTRKEKKKFTNKLINKLASK